jgi:hypothetical protein
MLVTESVQTSFFTSYLLKNGAPDGAVVEALRYKPGGRGFDSQLCKWNLSFT